MKANVKILIAAFSLFIIVANVSAQNPVGQCSPELTDWAKANVEYYSTAPRSEFVALPYEKQQALYDEFSGETIVALWQYKAGTVASDGSLSDAEKAELKKLYAYVQPRHFDTSEGKEEFNAFASEWAAGMTKDYGWDEEKLFLWTYTWLTKDEIEALKAKK